MVFDGLFADAKLDGNLLIEIALCHVGEDFGLPWCEGGDKGFGAFTPGEVLKLLQYLMGYLGLGEEGIIDGMFAGGGSTDCRHQLIRGDIAL